MSIQDILKNFSGVKIVEQKNDTIFAIVDRGYLSELSTKLVDEHGLFLSLLYGTDNRAEKQTFGVHAIFGNDKEHEWLKLSTELPQEDPQYPSLTATIMAAHWYERYMQDMFGITAIGHPDPRRLVNHENIPVGTYPLRKDFAWNTKLEKDNVPYPMHHVSGEGIYEIPVGPIHAGIIEPGHFRFNVAGERILTLEGKLFFTHKGVEKLMEGKIVNQALPFIERLSGDMAASHALAFSQAVEKISDCQISQRASVCRTLLVELERLTMHIHDLANIGGMGTGYSFVAANGFRIKERMMRLSADITGNRFWRGMIVPGGMLKDIDNEKMEKILSVSKDAHREMLEIVTLALASDGFMDRLQTTGVLPLEAAKAFGALGIAARGSGLNRDTRRDHPYDAYKKYDVRVSIKNSGDVHARYLVRIEEMKNTLDLIEKLIVDMPSGEVLVNIDTKDGFAIGAVESWRGEILCALEIKNGVVERCFPRDPSFCNWALFGIMGPGNIVPDFPLINKSLNLSYSGTDL
ncbi:MAG: NADH dehydrogenase subunit E [Candidatus Moranbacteria bacterium GW2011_GWE1_36_7]|nr:MAG: NADH dehydrogenase subunit E [Candidatus Moranbacteria bacterium GW2011_GWD2_36_12]KKQ06874.1 MAG: NADH dehydrogenase subunit E [Candidatus Moranbacteria bacterium GW2011_GWE2_36_40]KKQ13726.1 MAG: NADH dehydrogenase subunit E [Candidatus Moranbacteria bacterium GW2011_GWE1_36_7]